MLGLYLHITLLLIIDFSKEDMAKSLLHMISNDIGQLACLYAKLHNLSRVYFGGFFIRGHPVTMHTITYSINFFTKVSQHSLLQESTYYPFRLFGFLVDFIIWTWQCLTCSPDQYLVFCCFRAKFRPYFWDMKAILEPLERFWREQSKTVRGEKCKCLLWLSQPSCLQLIKAEWKLGNAAGKFLHFNQQWMINPRTSEVKLQKCLFLCQPGFDVNRYHELSWWQNKGMFSSFTFSEK